MISGGKDCIRCFIVVSIHVHVCIMANLFGFGFTIYINYEGAIRVRTSLAREVIQD